jgi:N-acetyl sugar amidotransferase
MVKKMKYCTRCVMPSTRPRVTFNDEGVCNACQWAEDKKTSVDWNARWKQLEHFCEKYRSKDGNFDVLLPVSGGKDSCYVSHRIKNDLGMHPLAVSIVPPFTFKIGDKNLDNFIAHGYDCIKIYPNIKISKRIARQAFIEYGQPLMSWIIAVQVAVFKTAINFNIPFIMFGEEGEMEYGGSSKLRNSPFYKREDSIKIYCSNIVSKEFLDEFSEKELYWWIYPSEKEFEKAQLAIAHWSYFESWDPYRNYLVAKEVFGLEERSRPSIGTYTNFAQTDTPIFDLHHYLMYLKFGFGRCSADASIDIRRGALDRDQAVELVKKFDNAYPEPYIDKYLDFFDMTKEEFDAALDKNANKDLFKKVNGRWTPTFTVE